MYSAVVVRYTGVHALVMLKSRVSRIVCEQDTQTETPRLVRSRDGPGRRTLLYSSSGHLHACVLSIAAASCLSSPGGLN